MYEHWTLSAHSSTPIMSTVQTMARKT